MNFYALLVSLSKSTEIYFPLLTNTEVKPAVQGSRQSLLPSPDIDRVYFTKSFRLASFCCPSDVSWINSVRPCGVTNAGSLLEARG